MSLTNRFWSWNTRRHKRKSKVWLVRFRITFDNLWIRFYRMERSEKTLLWLERNHKRILNIIPPWRIKKVW